MARWLEALAGATLIAAAPGGDGPRVAATGGTVEGARTADGALFRGVPFATAERWRPPEPARWRGVRRAVDSAPACLQGDYGWNRAEHVFAAEDCLALDIQTPGLAGRRPVLVWIHGGSNHAGGPRDAVPSSMVRQGIVVVGVRYRLGTLGFLAPRDGRASAGNYGLMDQIAALRWVRDNIARFGGDPGAVTIAGESAGAQDVGLLMLAPAARGLFHRAILQSGTPGFGVPWRSLAEARRIGDQLRARLGAVDPAVASGPALIAADATLHDAALSHDDWLWLRTTIDGDVLPRAPEALLAEARPVPMLIGTNAVELELWGGRSHRDAFLAMTYGANADRARVHYGIAEGRDPPAGLRSGSIDHRIATDGTFACPADRFARAWAAKGAPVYRYLFDASPDGGRTAHARELSYVWGQDRVGGDVRLQDYWAAFVKTGLPTPAWPRWPQRMRFDAAGATAEAAPPAPVCGLADAL